MEMKNFTGGENLQTYAELYCSVEITGEVHGQLIFLSVINIFLSITAFLGNTLILVALHKDTSIHPPSKLLYRNLAITDLCVGIIVEPLNVAHWTSVVNKRWDICYYTYLTAHFAAVTLCSVSLIILTAKVPSCRLIKCLVSVFLHTSLVPSRILFTAVLPRDKTHRSHHGLIKRARQTPSLLTLSPFPLFPQFLGLCSR